MTDAGGASYEQQLAIAVTNVAENQSRNGTTAADVFTATSDDNWTINAKGGNDVVNGGGGNDVLSLGAGDDIVIVNPGGGFDRIDGGAGNDLIVATAVKTVIGIESVAGIETISAGGFANVTIMGSAAANVLDFSGTSLLGIASIGGGAGNDQITGSAGDDRIIGGAGVDVFAYAVRGDSGIGVKADHITDFAAGVDKIDLSALDANAGLTGKQAFTFIGDAAFTGLGQLRVGLSGGHVVVEANVTGSLVADFSIVLDSNPALTVGDFVL